MQSTFNCPHFGATLAKPASLLLSDESARGGGIFISMGSGPTTCPRCRNQISISKIAAGAYDAAPNRPSALQEFEAILNAGRDRPASLTPHEVDAEHAAFDAALRYEDSRRAPSAGGTLVVVLLLLGLAAGGIWYWQHASTSWSTGKLIVKVEAEHIRTPYYWVYLKETGKPDRIIASRGPSWSDAAWAQPVVLNVPPGQYTLELFRSHPEIDANSKCAFQSIPWSPIPVASAGVETRVAFGLNSETEREWRDWGGDCQSHGYAVPPGYLLQAVRSHARDCDANVARLMGELGASQTSKAVLRERYGPGAKEYDGQKIRHMAKALQSGCWVWLKGHLPYASASERAVLSPIVEQSRMNINQLYTLADRLDAMRRQ